MATDLAPKTIQTDDGDDLHHLYCCDPSRAHCGTDISDYDHVEEPDDADCIVCLELDDEPCPRCGE